MAEQTEGQTEATTYYDPSYDERLKIVIEHNSIKIVDEAMEYGWMDDTIKTVINDRGSNAFLLR